MKKALVIGAQNIDIFATTNNEYVLHDSNIAGIHIAYGGVGRNMLENIKRLGNDVHFLTSFGDDELSKLAKQSLIDLGIYIGESLQVVNATNSVYMGIMDKDNDLYLGLNDMGIVRKMNPEFFQSKYEYIESFDILVIDNNLTKESIEYLVTTHDKEIVMDAVSAHKVSKLKELLQYINVLKLNQIELQELTDSNSVEEQIQELQSLHCNNLLITNQEKDIYYVTKDHQITSSPIQVDDIINATGAGDAFISGFIHGMIHELTDGEKLSYAKRVAYITLQSPNSTSNRISIEEVSNIEEK